MKITKTSSQAKREQMLKASALSSCGKCPECGEMNTKDNSITHNKRQYCFKCYELLEKRKKEREYLLKYICCLYGLNPSQKMDGRILKDLKELM